MMSIKTEAFGRTEDGKEILLYTITNTQNTVLKVTNYGACWVSMMVADQQGEFDDVVLGFDDGKKYEVSNLDAFGATVGRHANRIGNAVFTLNGKTYPLAKNDGLHSLHSGPDTYYTRLWDAELIADEEGEGVEFSILSPDGDQGMPGNLHISVSYVLTEDNSVVIEYNGVSDQDTIVNMTNHSYFNLGGHGSGTIENELVWIDADYFTFGEGPLVTTGEIRSVEGTPLDFRKFKRIGDEIDAVYEPLNRCGGYDHNFCLKNTGEEVNLVAKVLDEATGRLMEIFTDLPGMQMYTGNFITESNLGRGNTVYHPRDGVAFETQHYPDAINQPNFPSPVVKAGEAFNSVTIYRFSVVE